MSPSLGELRSQPHVSFSAIKTFLMCPRRYRLQYIDRVRSEYRAAAISFGHTWHEVVGVWLVREDVTAEELRDHLRDRLSVSMRDHELMFDDEDDNESTFVDTGVRMLNAFLAKVSRPERTLAVEVPFGLELGHPITGEILPVKFIGAIDALVVESGNKSVWELKTGKRKWSDQLEYDLQTTAYRIAARELGHGDVELRLVLTTKGKKPDVQSERLVRHRRDEREFVETVFAVRRAAEAGVDYPNRGWQCRTCAFAGACGA